MEDRIFDILFKEDEVTWKTLIVELVKNEQMDPWDIDISALAQKYITMVRKLQQADLRISGKVLLAASILLRMKSDILLTDDIAAFDNMMNPDEETSLLESLGIDQAHGALPYEKRKLIPRTPQPRARKVSLNDLMDALQQALETNRRRMLNVRLPQKMEPPKKKFDITLLMRNVYEKVTAFFTAQQNQKLYFHHIVPENTREGKVLTFIPLLHLSNERKILMDQQQHFGDIEIMLRTEKAVEEELGKGAV
ncbi:MAG TPA: ScpA family protein [Candidatus Nanoarchaeia archaeon]|nr:ScpA family protein [Candidatus Nanoarchaeia archaeon]